MEDLLRETYRTFNEVRKLGVTPKSIQAVMGSREAVLTLARRMPGTVRKTGFALDAIAADLGICDGETLFYHLVDCPRRPALIERFEDEWKAFVGFADDDGSERSADSGYQGQADEPFDSCPF